MSKMTEGPWRLQNTDSRVEWTIRAQGTHVSGVIATVRVDWTHENQCEEQKTNAKAMAKVPEMVEALEMWMNTWIQLVNSGDCGFWDPETNEEVIKTRALLKEIGK